MKKVFCIYLLTLIGCNAMAQNDSAVYFKFTTAKNRAAFYNNLVQNSITKNLLLPLNTNNESSWQNAFDAIELINYNQPWMVQKFKIAAASLPGRSIGFQQTMLEMLCAGNYKQFTSEVKQLLVTTSDAKIFAMSAVYLLISDTTKNNRLFILKTINRNAVKFNDVKGTAIIAALNFNVQQTDKKLMVKVTPVLKNLFSKNYLKGSTVVYSIQRKNRNYTGIAMVKDTAGNFITSSNNELFFVPQLAKSLSNMPCFITNGNTPQGVFRLYGFSSSRSSFIGPVLNLQLTMPYETSIQKFLNDSTITDTVWSRQLYARLLPAQLKNYEPLYQIFYAGAAGRTEIIAHGTAVDPAYYSGQIYYPFTPTAGCLCTKEIWDAEGKLIFSDEQKLVNAVKKAGGANGYLVVVEIDDAQKAVSAQEVLPYLQ